jgi:hypothetical protein
MQLKKERSATTVLLPRKLKERAWKVATKHGEFTEMVIAGLEEQVALRERRQQPTESQEQATAKAS